MSHLIMHHPFLAKSLPRNSNYMYMHLIRGISPLTTNLDETRVCDYLVRFNDVHERLLQSYFTNAAHVEAIHVLPPCGGCGVGVVWGYGLWELQGW